jgi:hypothetical protein
LAIDPDKDVTEALALHTRWARMHWLRTLIGTPAFFIYLWLLAKPALIGN